MSMRAVLSAALLSVALASTAFADSVTFYYDRPSWAAASHNLTTISFDGLAGNYSSPTGLTVSGVNFVGNMTQCYYQSCWSWNYLEVVSSAFGTGHNLQGTLSSGGPAPMWGSTTITLPPGTTSIGFDFWLMWWSGPQRDYFTITLSTGNSTTILTDPYGPLFFGVTSPVPID